MRSPFLILSLVAVLATSALAWSKEDHEIFRLHDEVQSHEGEGTTFYDFIGVKAGPAASQDDIVRTFKKTSIRLHPDKHRPAIKNPTKAQLRDSKKLVSERYARLTSVAEILRGPGRERYDHFLKNGFPIWRGSGYYYSRFRPGLGSVLVGLFVLCGIMHYGVLWVNARQQRKFMTDYIKSARIAAWGKSGIPGLPALDSTDSSSTTAASFQKLSRAERRAGGKSRSPSAPVATPQGAKRRVVADNGKVLLVDSAGDVYLVEQDEDGNEIQLMLDLNEIEGPKIRNTLLVTLPLWLVRTSVGRLIPSRKAQHSPPSSDSSDVDTTSENEAEKGAGSATVKKSAKKSVAKKLDRSDGLPRRKVAAKRAAKK